MKRRHAIKTRERKRIISQIRGSFPEIGILTKSSIEIGIIDDLTVFLINGNIDFIQKNDVLIPTIPAILKYNIDSNFVTVDEGAVRFIVNGADVMAPGVVDADLKIKEGDPVWVKEEKYGKPLATGLALLSGEEMKTKERGKAVKTLHHVGDKLWKSISKSL
jgi:PUA domain protein